MAFMLSPLGPIEIQCRPNGRGREMDKKEQKGSQHFPFVLPQTKAVKNHRSLRFNNFIKSIF